MLKDDIYKYRQKGTGALAYNETQQFERTRLSNCRSEATRADCRAALTHWSSMLIRDSRFSLLMGKVLSPMRKDPRSRRQMR